VRVLAQRLDHAVPGVRQDVPELVRLARRLVVCPQGLLEGDVVSLDPLPQLPPIAFGLLRELDQGGEFVRCDLGPDSLGVPCCGLQFELEPIGLGEARAQRQEVHCRLDGEFARPEPVERGQAPAQVDGACDLAVG
jgi:hypothetical protein